MKALEENNLIKLFEDMVKVHPKITIDELNDIYKQFEKVATKKIVDKSADTHLLKNHLIDMTRYENLIYYFLPHLEKQKVHVEPILYLLFKRGDRKDKQIMNFEEFIDRFEILWRGSLIEQFEACFFLFFTHTDAIAKENFKYLVYLLYRITFTGSTSEEEIKCRLDIFADVIYESLKGHQETFTYNELIEMFQDRDLLVDFWQQLYRE